MGNLPLGSHSINWKAEFLPRSAFHQVFVKPPASGTRSTLGIQLSNQRMQSCMYILRTKGDGKGPEEVVSQSNLNQNPEGERENKVRFWPEVVAAGAWYPPCQLCICNRSSAMFSVGSGDKETGYQESLSMCPRHCSLCAWIPSFCCIVNL